MKPKSVEFEKSRSY